MFREIFGLFSSFSQVRIYKMFLSLNAAVFAERGFENCLAGKAFSDKNTARRLR